MKKKEPVIFVSQKAHLQQGATLLCTIANEAKGGISFELIN